MDGLMKWTEPTPTELDENLAANIELQIIQLRKLYLYLFNLKL